MEILLLLLRLLLYGLYGVYGDGLAIWPEKVGQLSLLCVDGLAIRDQLAAQQFGVDIVEVLDVETKDRTVTLAELGGRFALLQVEAKIIVVS